MEVAETSAENVEENYSDEEETYVVVELGGVIDKDYFSKSGDNCKILNLDSENPLLEIGGAVYSGEYKDTVGTSVLFEEEYRDPVKVSKWNVTSTAAKPAANKEQELFTKYHSHTHKKLVMNRVFLAEKGTKTEEAIIVDGEDEEDEAVVADVADEEDEDDEDLIDDDDDIDEESKSQEVSLDAS